MSLRVIKSKKTPELFPAIPCVAPALHSCAWRGCWSGATFGRWRAAAPSHPPRTEQWWPHTGTGGSSPSVERGIKGSVTKRRNIQCSQAFLKRNSSTDNKKSVIIYSTPCQWKVGWNFIVHKTFFEDDLCEAVLHLSVFKNHSPST